MSIKKLITDNTNGPLGQPDPYIIYSRGKYYIYATAYDGVAVYQSDTLSDFVFKGYALTAEGQKEFWAPCVIEEDGLYYMYYSSMPASSGDVHEQALKVAVSNDPLSGFTYRCDLIPPFSIDAHVVKNDKNESFIFYSVNDCEAARAGTLIVVDKLVTPFKTEGKPVVAVRPTLDEEIFMRDRFKAGQHWHTIEGAFYFKEKDKHFIMYSGNCYQKPEYYIGYAAAEGNDDDLRKLNFKKSPDENTYQPFMSKNAEEEGTGHNSVIKADGQYYIVYHARDYDAESGKDTRTARIKKFNAYNDKLILE